MNLKHLKLLRYSAWWKTRWLFLKLDTKAVFKNLFKNMVQSYYRKKVDKLLKIRNKHRKRGNYEEADRIKNTLLSLGIKIKDKKGFKSDWYL
jgi:cysteinyl-tRNA synthetase